MYAIRIDRLSVTPHTDFSDHALSNAQALVDAYNTRLEAQPELFVPVPGNLYNSFNPEQEQRQVHRAVRDHVNWHVHNWHVHGTNVRSELITLNLSSCEISTHGLLSADWTPLRTRDQSLDDHGDPSDEKD